MKILQFYKSDDVGVQTTTNMTGFEKTRLPHTHNIKLTISPEMNYWLKTLSYSTAGLAPKP